MPSNTLESTPSGLSPVFKRNGVTPPMIAVLLTPVEAVFPEVVRNFATSNRETHERKVMQLEMAPQRMRHIKERQAKAKLAQARP